MIRLILETVLHAGFFPGIVIVAIPYMLVSSGFELYAFAARGLRIVGGLAILGGLLLGLWCTRHFIVLGRGTPNPIDPPRSLVRAGPYHLVRNPMYVSLGVILAGEALALGSVTLVAYLVIVILVLHLVVVLYEEPTLRRSFGLSYGDYCRRVPRWIPRSV